MVKLFQWGKTSKQLLGTVSKYLELTANRAILKSNIDMSIPYWGGRRDEDLQEEMYDNGWSQCDGKTKLSEHQILDKDGRSKALDICAFIKGKQEWPENVLIYFSHLMIESFEELKEEGHIPKDIYLHWGGFWKSFKDLPHYEIKDHPQKIKA